MKLGPAVVILIRLPGLKQDVLGEVWGCSNLSILGVYSRVLSSHCMSGVSRAVDLSSVIKECRFQSWPGQS